MDLTAVYVKVPEGYVAYVEELPGANTQGATLAEAKENLQDAVAMILEVNRELAAKAYAGMDVTKEPFVVVSFNEVLSGAQMANSTSLAGSTVHFLRHGRAERIRG